MNVLPFPKSSERDHSRDLGHGVCVRVQGWSGAMVQLPRSPTRKIVVRGTHCRYQSPTTSPGQLGDEASAYCCSLVALFLDRRGRTVDFKNFSRRFKAPGSLLLSALQAGKQSARGISESFKTFLRCLVLVHDEDSSEGTISCAPKEFPKTEKEFPRIA